MSNQSRLAASGPGNILHVECLVTVSHTGARRVRCPGIRYVEKNVDLVVAVFLGGRGLCTWLTGADPKIPPSGGSRLSGQALSPWPMDLIVLSDARHRNA